MMLRIIALYNVSIEIISVQCCRRYKEVSAADRRRMAMSASKALVFIRGTGKVCQILPTLSRALPTEEEGNLKKESGQDGNALDLGPERLAWVQLQLIA